jgi:hypothetical protein
LDATDEEGMPYKPDNEALYCPMHFINTTKKPNVVFLDGPVVNQIMFVNLRLIGRVVSSRAIVAGHELFVEYGDEAARDWL